MSRVERYGRTHNDEPGIRCWCGDTHVELIEICERDVSGRIVRGPSLLCGCPLDADCDGYHAIGDTDFPYRR
jgi:hypothetical protein